MDKELIISSSPHIHTQRSVERTMLDVLIALLPAVACSLFFFGAGALVVLLSAVAGCVATEYLIQRFLIKGKSTIGNYSAIVTGVLLALNLPSNLPVYIVILGSIFSIGIVQSGNRRTRVPAALVSGTDDHLAAPHSQPLEIFRHRDRRDNPLYNERKRQRREHRSIGCILDERHSGSLDMGRILRQYGRQHG